MFGNFLQVSLNNVLTSGALLIVISKEFHRKVENEQYLHIPVCSLSIYSLLLHLIEDMLMGSNICIIEARNSGTQDYDKFPEYVEFTFVIYINLPFWQKALLNGLDSARSHVIKPRLLHRRLCIFFITNFPYALLHFRCSQSLVLIDLIVNLR